MRIWHEDLIPLLCRQHLLSCWREGLGILSILTNGKQGYRNHPAVKEWEHGIKLLYFRLSLIRWEMIKRGYKPKALPMILFARRSKGFVKQWQTLEEQIEILKSKKCDCKIFA